MDNINNFKLLEYLGLSDMEFHPSFELKLNNLKKLRLDGCKNIAFKKDIFLKLEDLEISCCKIINSNYLLKMPKLKKLILGHIYDKIKIIDFSSLYNLKCFSASPFDFLFLENSPLEILNLFHEYNYKDIGDKVFTKIISMNFLKEINFHMDVEWKQNILKTYGENYSVSKIKIYWHHSFEIYRLSDFQNNFPNLSDLTIIYYDFRMFTLGANTVEIKESLKSKVKKISIDLNRHDYTITLNIQPFEKVEYIDLYSDILNINELPFFQPNNLRQFNSLKYFSFYFIDDGIKYKNILEHLYNNINNMPNLIEFRLFYSQLSNIDKNFSINLVRRVLGLKSIKRICIRHGSKYYSKSELKLLLPDINFNNYYKIEISII